MGRSKMTKQQIADCLAERQGISKQMAKRAVDLVFEGMAEELARGGKVEIRGFGSFQVRSYDSYTSRNPKTGERIEVEPKRTPHFRVGRDLFKRLNSS
jgi:integration host factor subunit beta